MISEEIAITGITITWKSLPEFSPVPLSVGGVVSLFFVTGVVGGDGVSMSGSLVGLVVVVLQIKRWTTNQNS